MSRSKEPVNPFYWLCIAAGVVFTVTACAYGLLMLRANRGLILTNAAGQEHPLMSLLDHYGMIILSVEVAILAVASFAAIFLDHVRGQRLKSERKHESKQRESSPG